MFLNEMLGEMLPILIIPERLAGKVTILRIENQAIV